MPLIRIEMFRNGRWQIRQQGMLEITAQALAEQLTAYATKYPHRAYLDGRLVTEKAPPRNARRP